jgi:ribosome-associated toxin RatA of RatAB toxin-antitoxin module
MANLGGEASIEVNAPLADVWALVEDVAIAPEWQDGLERLTPLENDDKGRPTLVETESDAKVKTITTKVRFNYDEEPNKLKWSQEKGDLKSLDGAWILEEVGPEKTKVTYFLDGDPGRMLGMLIRGPVEGKIRDILVNGRPGELKARIEGG